MACRASCRTSSSGLVPSWNFCIRLLVAVLRGHVLLFGPRCLVLAPCRVAPVRRPVVRPIDGPQIRRVAPSLKVASSRRSRLSLPSCHTSRRVARRRSREFIISVAQFFCPSYLARLGCAVDSLVLLRGPSQASSHHSLAPTLWPHHWSRVVRRRAFFL